MKSKVIWGIEGDCLEGALITTAISGIINSIHGNCIREGKEGYDKD